MKVRAQKIRWIFLIVSFILLGWGLFGLKVQSVKIPILACPKIENIAVDGVCINIILMGGELRNSLDVIGSIKPYIISIMSATILTLAFGRLWCGYVCPFGFLQELLSALRNKLRIKSLKFSRKIENLFKVMKWILLFVFLTGLGFCNICPVRYTILPVAGGIYMDFNIIGIIITALILMTAFFKERCFCKICPIGLLMGLANKTSFARIKKNCTSCTECGICYDACPMDISLIYTERTNDNVTSNECIYCMKCIDQCPEKDALSFHLFSKKMHTAERNNFYKNQGL